MADKNCFVFPHDKRYYFRSTWILEEDS